jgi:hypothetical protein
MKKCSTGDNCIVRSFISCTFHPKLLGLFNAGLDGCQINTRGVNDEDMHILLSKHFKGRYYIGDLTINKKLLLKFLGEGGYKNDARLELAHNRFHREIFLKQDDENGSFITTHCSKSHAPCSWRDLKTVSPEAYLSNILIIVL